MLKVFAADQSDLDWMFQLYIHAANNGHFAIKNTPAGRDVVKENIFSIVTYQKMVDFNLQAQALVFESGYGKVGYVVMSELEPGLGGNEIQLFVVDEKLRGMGYGSYMLEEVIRRWHPLVDIYARCHPASSQMAAMLRKANFGAAGKSREGADMYILARAS